MTAAQRYVKGSISPDRENRERDDFYPTPPSGTRALLEVETFEGSVWEPACGDGAISKVLEAAGHEVISTDLIDRGYGQGGVDFLLDFQTRADNVITNPPFKLCDAFIWHALARARRKVAILGRLSLLEGQKRQYLYSETPIARVWVFSKRLTILREGKPAENSGGGNGMVAFAWFVWDWSHKGPPVLGWINPVEGD